MRLKYIIVQTQYGAEYGIVFPETLIHSDVARIRRIGYHGVVSAGWCDRAGGKWRAWGHSESLHMDSREQDAAILDKSFPDDQLSGSCFK